MKRKRRKKNNSFPNNYSIMLNKLSDANNLNFFLFVFLYLYTLSFNTFYLLCLKFCENLRLSNFLMDK